MYLIIDNKKIPLKNYTTFINRLKGLMFTKIKIKEGIIFPHCNSIHTLFMYQDIDVIFLNKSNKIIKYYKCVKKNKILFSIHANKVIELPSNTIKTDLLIGSTLKIFI